MADNISLNSGSGGDSIGADDISSVKYPRGKLVHGIDGTNDGDVALTNPLPTAVVFRTDKMSDGTTTLISATNAIIDTAASAEIVAANASKKIRIVQLSIEVATTTTVKIFSGGAAGTALTGAMTILAGSALVWPFSPVGWVENEAVNKNIYFTLGAAVQTSGVLKYVLV